jgi:4-amino-4-deoxy-L-arabinose transferase-like glycosyltransferase
MLDEQILAGRRAIILIALFCAPFFINLGANSLWDGNEGFYAEPPREMLETKNYLAPTYNYEPRLKKPPFTSWVIASCYATLGVNELAERLPAACAATLLILLLYWAGAGLRDKETGMAAALILATMLKFMVYARQFAGDIFLTLFIAIAIIYFARAMLEPPSGQQLRYKLIAYAAIGFGMLDKGLVAIVIPMAVIGLFILLMRRWDLIKLLFSPTGYLIIMLIGLPWYIMMCWKYGWQFFQINIVQETVKRYTTDELGGRAIYYYFGVYFAETLPWSLFTIPLFVYWGRWLKREWRRLPKIELSACMPLLPLIWFIFVFVFFSLSIGKRANYMIILYPAAALMISHYFTARNFDSDPLIGRLHRLMLWLLIAICLAGATFIFMAYNKLAVRSALIFLPIVALAAFAIGLCWLCWQGRAQRLAQWIACGGLGITLSLALLLPKIEFYRPLPRFAAVVKKQAGAQDEVGTFFVDTPSLMFYSQRKIFQCWNFDEMLHRLDSDHPIYFVTRQDYLQMLQSRTAIPLVVIDSQPLLQLRWGNFIGNNSAPTLRLMLVRKG